MLPTLPKTGKASTPVVKGTYKIIGLFVALLQKSGDVDPCGEKAVGYH